MIEGRDSRTADLLPTTLQGLQPLFAARLLCSYLQVYDPMGTALGVAVALGEVNCSHRCRHLCRLLALHKATNGIKRHLAVDILGFPFFTHCTPANVSDDDELLEMLKLNLDYFKAKPVNIVKITILLDHGYHRDYLTQELEKVYPQIMTKIRFEFSANPSKQEKGAQGKSGFVPAVARWVIERSNAWMEHCKSLTKNFERTLSHAKTKVDSALSGSSGLQPLLKISNGFYRKPENQRSGFTV